MLTIVMCLEPSNRLDPEATESLYNTIDELREDAVGVLVVTHDVSAALPHATKVLEVRNGAVVLLLRRGSRQRCVAMRP